MKFPSAGIVLILLISVGCTQPEPEYDARDDNPKVKRILDSLATKLRTIEIEEVTTNQGYHSIADYGNLVDTTFIENLAGAFEGFPIREIKDSDSTIWIKWGGGRPAAGTGGMLLKKSNGKYKIHKHVAGM
ncbi:MAG: hypothetical protein JKX73_07865 [Flavobacteriales bacterium]|nr:hypothetical protein [Flavobacteriales bacterium]